jgi:integrase
LAGIDALAVREWVAELVAGGLSARRARKAHAVLSQVLASAVEGGRLTRSLAAGIKLPKVQRTEMHFLDAEQVEALAEAIDARYGTLIRFAAYSGLRPSELTALRIGRLDLLRGTARVVEAAPEVDGRLHWGGVKTHEARTVRLPRSVAEELGADLAGRARDGEALVFTAPLGGPLRPHTWVANFFKPALRVAGRPEALRLYDLRHTCASLLTVQGASVKAVQAQLGHATASITLDTYGHLFPSELEALADRLEQTRMAALANRERTQRGPGVVRLTEAAGG